MSEIMNLEQDFSSEQDAQSRFLLTPYHEEHLSGAALVQRRAATTTLIKESLQNYLHLDEDVRVPREVSTRSSYVWAILNDLGMVDEDNPTKSFREAYANAHDKGNHLTVDERSELMEKHDDHPFIGYIRTINEITPNDRLTQKELAVLYRSSLVLLDEYSQ